VHQVKARAGARRVRLVGGSGGGVLAALVAGRRGDVAGLVTVAAPLDLAAWTQSQGLSPLTPSLNPADSPAMPDVPQAHLFGRYDPVVRPETASAAARRLGGPHAIVDVWPQKHGCCWARAAREIAAALRTASGLAAAVPNAADETAAEP
jgi:pimeloyl-ACP methyl ester carboxylesterase